MFYVPRDRQLTVKLWQAIAKRYAGNPAILGYDILNEPIAPYHDVAMLNPRLEPFYREVTTAIREVDPGRIVFLAGGQWSSSFDMFGPPFAYNLAYTYHLFWASTKRDSIQRHLNFSSRYDVPMFLGETGELTDEWNARFRKLNETTRYRLVVLDLQESRHALDRGLHPAPRRLERDRGLRRRQADDQADVAQIYCAIGEYLDGIRFRNGVVRWSYLELLGLKGEPWFFSSPVIRGRAGRGKGLQMISRRMRS